MSIPTAGDFQAVFADSYRTAEKAKTMAMRTDYLIRQCEEQIGPEWERRANLLRQTLKRIHAVRKEMEGVRSRLINSWDTGQAFNKPTI